MRKKLQEVWEREFSDRGRKGVRVHEVGKGENPNNTPSGSQTYTTRESGKSEIATQRMPKHSGDFNKRKLDTERKRTHPCCSHLSLKISEIRQRVPSLSCICNCPLFPWLLRQFANFNTVGPRYLDTLRTRKMCRPKRSVAVTGVGETDGYKKLYFSWI